MCLWPTVAPTACTRCLHTWTRLLWSPHPGTFLLPLKSFAPRPSYPESFMLRAGTPAIVLGTWRHYLQRGLLHPPKAEGAWRGLKPFLDKQREGVRVFAGGRGMRPRTIFHCTANFPTQLEGHQGLSCLICSWQTQELFYTWVSTPEPSSSEWMSCSQPSRSPAWQDPLHTPGLHTYRGRWTTCVRAPGAVAWCFLLGVLEIMTAQACTKSGDFSFKCLHNIFESIRCSGWGFSYFGFQDTQLLTLWRAHCKFDQTRDLNCQLKQGETGQPLPCIDSKDRGKKTCCGLDFCFA